MTTPGLKTKFPMYQSGDQHWEALLETLGYYRAHENGYTGESYYEEYESMMLTLGSDNDRPWCCEYTKETFVKAWNKVKEMV